MEYVSDLENSTEEDMEELQELDDDRPNEAESEVSKSDVDQDDSVSQSHSGEDESADEKDFTTSQESKPGSKRKRGAQTQKARKKVPLVQIEYEQEGIAPNREILHA